MKTPSQLLLALVRPNAREVKGDVLAVHRARELEFPLLGTTWTWHSNGMLRRGSALLEEATWRRVSRSGRPYGVMAGSALVSALLSAGVGYVDHSVPLATSTFVLSSLGISWVGAKRLITSSKGWTRTSEVLAVYEQLAEKMRLPEIEPGQDLSRSPARPFWGVNAVRNGGDLGVRAGHLRRFGIHHGMSLAEAESRLAAYLGDLQRMPPGARGRQADAALAAWDQLWPWIVGESSDEDEPLD